jgi:hypothetical protein
VHAAPSMASGSSAIWVAGEFRPTPGQRVPDAPTVEIQVSGAASGSARAVLAAGQRTFLVPVALDGPFDEGSLDVRARLAGSGVPLTDAVRIEAGTAVALLARRGPATGNRWEPAGAPQFSRTERLRLELPAGSGETSGEGRVLDRNGQPLGVPVTMGERTDERGTRWITAEITLAPLGAGDYAIEMRAGDRRVLTAIRLTR